MPADKNEIAMYTAMAGEMLGMKLIYMDAGSGAKHIEVPLIIAAVLYNRKKHIWIAKPVLM